MKRYAIISDIHGNRWALEAVLNDVRRQGISHLINLGDSLYGPLDPSGTAERLMILNMRSVSGNEDRVICSAGHIDPSPTLRYVRSSIRSKHLDWLSTIPPTAAIDDKLFACHASPCSDTEYLFWHVGPTGTVLRSNEEMAQMIKGITLPVILCGHDHIPRSVVLKNGILVVNPGSVGLQAFQDETPYYHVMQNHSPHARYAIVTEENGEWRAENRRVAYDWESAAALADKNGRHDWANWLRTGETNTD
jgi:predicted phosphodiesterase